MVPLIILLILIIFFMWIVRPFLKTTEINKSKETSDNTLNSEQKNLRPKNNTLILIPVVIFLALVVWLLLKLGINFFALFQRMFHIISYMRGILPF